LQTARLSTSTRSWVYTLYYTYAPIRFLWAVILTREGIYRYHPIIYDRTKLVFTFAVFICTLLVNTIFLNAKRVGSRYYHHTRILGWVFISSTYPNSKDVRTHTKNNIVIVEPRAKVGGKCRKKSNKNYCILANDLLGRW